MNTRTSPRGLKSYRINGPVGSLIQQDDALDGVREPNPQEKRANQNQPAVPTTGEQTESELNIYRDCEEIAATGWQTFITVAKAPPTIRRRRLYPKEIVTFPIRIPTSN